MRFFFSRAKNIAVSSQKLFVFCAHYAYLDCAVNELNTQGGRGENAQLTGGIDWVCVQAHADVQRKSVRLQFPWINSALRLIFSTAWCVDKELLLFSFSDKVAELYLGTTSVSIFLCTGLSWHSFKASPDLVVHREEIHFGKFDNLA